MYVKSVTVEGFHNVSRKKYEFNPNMTYLMGRNGAGKSTVMQAIQLALLGYIPGTHKTNEAIFRHASNHTMAVTLEVSDGSSVVVIQRIWRRVKSKVESSVNVIPAGYDISCILGEIELPLFNFNEFVGMTANKLKDWFISFLPHADMDVCWRPTLEEALRRDAIEVVDETLVTSAVSDISAFHLSGMDEVRKANEYFKSALSFKKSEMQRYLSTVQSLVYYDDYQETMSDEELADKLRLLEIEKSQIHRANRDIQNNAAIQSRIQALGIEYDSISEDPEYASLQEQDKSIRQSIAALNASSAPLATRDAELRAEMSQMNRILSSDGSCPFTGTKCDSVLELKSKYMGRVSEIKEELKSISEKYADNSSALKKLQSDASAVSYKISSIQKKYSAAEAYRNSIVPVSEYSTRSVEEVDGEISTIRDMQVKQSANRKYNSLIDQLTLQKYQIEQAISAYKCWIDLTGVNGLQTNSEDNPFEKLTYSMNKYLKAIFSEDVSAGFNMEGKSNSFNFGLWRDSLYIPYDLLSSGEKCLYTFSMLTALVEVSNSKFRAILIDDLLDHLDDFSINKLFSIMESAEDIQFILAGVKPVDEKFNKSIIRFN